MSEGSLGTETPSKIRVLVTLPVYNEAPRLSAAVEQLISTLSESRFDWRLSIAEDGSTDGTKEVLSRIEQCHPEVIVQAEPEKLGRGRALRLLWSKIDADVYCFVDTDLAMGVRPLMRAVDFVERGKDVVIGSRYVSGARVVRPPLRSIASKLYNGLVRAGVHDGIHDHQCGLKAFSRSAFSLLASNTREDSWFWDTEVLVVAKALGLRIEEIPVDWIELKYSRTPVRRLMSDIYVHGTGLLRLKSGVDSLRRSHPKASFGAGLAPKNEPSH